MKNNPIKTSNIICAILLICLIITQLIPFWSYGSPEKTISIFSFVWLLTDHDAVSAELGNAIGQTITVNDVFAPAVLMLIAAIVGVILCFRFSESELSALAPFGAGIFGFWQYLGKSVYRLGSGWGFHFALCVVLAAISAMQLVRCVKKHSEEKAAQYA